MVNRKQEELQIIEKEVTEKAIRERDNLKTLREQLDQRQVQLKHQSLKLVKLESQLRSTFVEVPAL